MNRTPPGQPLVQEIFSIWTLKNNNFHLEIPDSLLRSPNGGDRLKQRLDSPKPFFLFDVVGSINRPIKSQLHL